MKYEDAFGNMIDKLTEKSEHSICLDCGEIDTYTTNGDCGWCSECRTVEGNFRWEDEDGNEL